MSALLLLLAASLCAAAEPPKDVRKDTTLVGASPLHWFATYSLSPYREFWSAALTVKSLGRDLPKVREAFAKERIQLTQPFENFPSSETDGTQQLSYKATGKAARAALKRLRKLGTLPEPVVRPSMEPVPLEEVKEKLRLLKAERDSYSRELASMPSTLALLEEAIAHLGMVRAVREGSDPEVLLNLTVRQAR